jgi:hypothetical protein
VRKAALFTRRALVFQLGMVPLGVDGTKRDNCRSSPEVLYGLTEGALDAQGSSQMVRAFVLPN